MGTAIFNYSDDLRQIIYHASANRQPVLLVHDQGLYFMTSGLQRPDDQTTALCAYAEGCDPKADEDCWDNARSICGGDDFGEELEARTLAHMISEGTGLKVNFSETHLDIRAITRPEERAKEIAKAAGIAGDACEFHQL